MRTEPLLTKIEKKEYSQYKSGGNFGLFGVTMSTMTVTMVFIGVCIAIVFIIVTLILVVTMHVAFSSSN